MIPAIQAIISGILSKSISGERTVKDVVNKTNGVGISVVSFCLYRLQIEPYDKVYISLLVFSLLTMTLRDTLSKIMVLLKKD